MFPTAQASAAVMAAHTTWVTVHQNETMRSLAREHYGSSRYWKVIYDANRRPSKVTDLIYTGEHLREPVRNKHHWFAYPHGHHGGMKAVSKRRYNAVAYAYAKLGDPYVWAATGPNAFDCSGLTQAAYRYARVYIPRTSEDQAAQLPRGTLRPGSLLYFNGNSHAAIYVGRGMLIDAPHTGAFVEKVPLSGWFSESLDAVRSP